MRKELFDKKNAIEKLRDVMVMLRHKDYGCPWDLEQTLESLMPHTIEETYEVIDAIEKKDMSELVDELGDLLFQVIFYAQIADEENLFDFDDVANAIVLKLLRRHPHVFPTGEVSSFGEGSNISASEVSTNWDLIKLVEKEKKSEIVGKKNRKSALDDLPKAFPALLRSIKLQRRAAKVGFDWSEISEVISKLKEEITELEEAINLRDKEKTLAELGDVLFSAVNVARHAAVDPESALREANSRFENRFTWIEGQLEKEGKIVKDVGIDELNKLWSQAKLTELKQ